MAFNLFGWLSRIGFALLFATCRCEVFGQEIEKRYDIENHGRGLLYASWHRGLMYLIYRYRNQQAVVMASASHDGELAAQAVKRHGWIAVRGSSSYRGMEGLRELVAYAKKGHRAGLVVDAPRGPARAAKIGIIIAARMTGLPVLPIIWSTDRCWRLRSWDRTMVPKPFARIVFLYGEDFIRVPPKASRTECEHYRLQLEQALNRMTYQADRYFCLPDIDDPRRIAVPETAAG